MSDKCLHQIDGLIDIFKEDIDYSSFQLSKWINQCYSQHPDQFIRNIRKCHATSVNKRIEQSIQQIIESNVIPHFVKILNGSHSKFNLLCFGFLRNHYLNMMNIIPLEVVNILKKIFSVQCIEELQDNIVTIFFQIAGGESEVTGYYVKYMIDNAVLDSLIRTFTTSSSFQVKSSVMVALANIVGENLDFVSTVAETNILQHIISFLAETNIKLNNYNLQLFQDLSFFILNTCRSGAIMDCKYQVKLLSIFIDLDDEQILTDILWAIEFVTRANQHIRQAVIDNHFLPRLTEISHHSFPAVQALATKLILDLSNNSNQTYDTELTHVTYECICGNILKKVNNAMSLYNGKGAYCDECEKAGLKYQIFWHCDDLKQVHDGGFDVCDDCIDDFAAIDDTDQEFGEASNISESDIKVAELDYQEVDADETNLGKNVVEQCNVEECHHLKQLINVMQEYTQMITGINIENSCNIKNNDVSSILNDYLHVLCDHENKQQLGGCDMHQCSIFQRNYRNREELRNNMNGLNNLYSHNNSSLSIEVLQILDKIHCAFYHEIPKNNIIQDEDEIKDAETKEDKYDLFDKRIRDKSNKQQNVDTDESVHIRKFDDQQLNAPRIVNNMYHFGYMFNYDELDRYNVPFGSIDVKKLYQSLKEELLQNILQSINVKQFNSEYNKA
eukprot:279820_1